MMLSINPRLGRGAAYTACEYTGGGGCGLRIGVTGIAGATGGLAAGAAAGAAAGVADGLAGAAVDQGVALKKLAATGARD